VRLNLLEETGVDGGPDRSGGRLVGVERVGVTRLIHVLHRDHDLDVEVPVVRDVDDGHRTCHPFPVFDRPAAEEAPDRLQGSLRGGKTDPLRRGVGYLLETLQGQRQVGAAFGAGNGMDLVGDDPADTVQDLACGRGEDEI
jgi:hypothetical protein